VNPTADPETIKAAYKALAGKYHPDNQTTGNAEKARRVIAAYEVLGDAAKRKAYDRNIGV
jgi:DnaJ-class molecular chaperone